MNDQPVGQSRIENTVSYQFLLDEMLDVGVDLATNVTDDYSKGDNAFTGTIHWVKIDLDSDDTSPTLDPELVFAGLMAGN